jgi:hypothetical protein
MQAQAIYKLQPILDNPIYEGFGGGDAPSLLGRGRIHNDFFPARRDQWDWTIDPLAPVWKPLKVVGRVARFNDYPCLGKMIPAFSDRAVAALRQFLEPNGELLPLDTSIGDYYAYNCRTVVEILDQTKCRASWMGKLPSCALDINYFSVIPERTAGLSIFRLRELCNWTFVSDQFADVVRETGLNGFHFVKVWPWPEGIDFRKEERTRRRAEGNRVKTESGMQEAKNQSLTLDFQLSGSPITKEEKQRLARFQDELDAQLLVGSADDVYFGSLEGRRTMRGRTRLLLSCPDHNSLFRKLLPWLKSIDWDPTPVVWLRDGPYDDHACEETVVKIQ